jgi:predicted Zn-dependent protease
LLLNTRIFLLTSLLCTQVAGLLCTEESRAQTRNLPPAAFQSFTRPGGEALPGSGGVHLTPGLDRPRGAAAQVYNPGEEAVNMGLVRWEKKKMPLLIWISPGIKLPDCSTFAELQATRVDTVFEMLKQPQPFVGLETARDWVPETNYAVASGIEQWRQFEGEGLISFGFTDDPRQAHILVFFTDGFRDSGGPGGVAIGGNTCAQIYPYAQAQQVKIAQKPIIIELATGINYSEERMRGASAHEFGHALGIKAHSPYRDDIMYADRVVNELSPSDKATLRFLYHKAPDYVM